MFKEIIKLHKQGYKCIAGLDEAGRGPLAGPVTASAVALEFPISKFQFPNKLQILNSKFKKIKDSKKLTAKKREVWYEILTSHPQISWGVGIVSEKIIDKSNILEATKLAMVKAVRDLEKKLGKPVDFLIIDGNFILASNSGVRPRSKLRGLTPELIDDSSIPGIGRLKQKAVVGADDMIFNCIAAGIIAKVTRDRLVMKLHKKYPQYGFDKHKGYGTKEHFLALRKHGPCEIHRKSFAPVKEAISS
jgi:ribonuclease HII